jgi:hypothetical protein
MIPRALLSGLILLPAVAVNADRPNAVAPGKPALDNVGQSVLSLRKNDKKRR